MSAATGPVAIVGGGMAGIIAALMLSRNGKRKVILLEREAELGGLWRSFDYGADGRFDLGTHNVSYCGIADIDAEMLGLLPRDDWTLLTGNSRDLSGIFYRGRLQTNSSSPDFRGLPDAARAELFGQIVSAAAAATTDQVDGRSAESFALGQWGDTLTRSYIEPILQRNFGKAAKDLGLMGLKLTALTRVILLDQEPMLDIMKSDRLRSRIAFPEQRALPSTYASTHQALYPAKLGMGRVVDAIRAKLLDRGVEILTQAEIADVTVTEGRIKAIDVRRNGTTHKVEGLASVLWAAGLPAAATLFKVLPADLAIDRPRTLHTVNLLVKDHADTDGLHYFYCYDRDFASFRTTLYRNFCPGARQAKGWPITVEMLDGNPAEVGRHAIDELVRFGILPDASAVTFQATETLRSAYPMPTLKNRDAIDLIRDRLQARGIGNLHFIGAQAEPQLFFQNDVLKHLWQTLQERC